MNWGAIAAGLLGLAVILGAFGAHGLKGRLDEYSMGIYEKAVFYHFVHGLGLLITAALAKSGALSAAAGSRVGWLLCAGIALFSGSLYALALSGVRGLGAITPLGGICLAAGWFVLAFGVARGNK